MSKVRSIVFLLSVGATVGAGLSAYANHISVHPDPIIYVVNVVTVVISIAAIMMVP